MIKHEMRVGGCDLSPKQEQAIILLARGMSIAETAKQIKTSEQTLHNWKAKHEFMEDLRDETRAYLSECRTRLGSLALPAIETLASLLNSDSPNIQLKAAQEILKANGLNTLDHGLFLLQGLGMETTYSKECDMEKHRENLLTSLTGLDL